MEDNNNVDSLRNLETNPILNILIIIATVLLLQACATEHYWKGGECANNKGVVGIRYDSAK